MTIRPQAGPQETFLSSPADIALYGGAAGAGKSFALLMEPLRHIHNPNFGTVIFRREMPQIVAEGGLWDTSYSLYSSLDAISIQQPLRWTFPSGAKIEFHHLQHEKHIRSWDGSQIPLLGFDEAHHFTEKQVFYLLTRNRSTCGIRPYCRMTCNPDPDSWLLNFLLKGGYIDKETGYPIPEMSGKLRYFVRISNIVYWSDTKEELFKQFGTDCNPKSFTFVPGKITDNPELLRADPGYVANLKAQPQYEQDRLLGGNWFARPNAGELFKRRYFQIVDTPPSKIIKCIRYWDRAATTPSEVNPDPDYTAGALVGKLADGRFILLDIDRDRVDPLEVEKMIEQNAYADRSAARGWIVTVGLEKDPGQAGKKEIDYYIRKFAGLNVTAFPKTVNKLTMWKPLAAQAKAGNVLLLRGKWNEDFIHEAEGVTDGGKTQKVHDDQIDAVAGAFMFLAHGMTNFNPKNLSLYGGRA